VIGGTTKSTRAQPTHRCIDRRLSLQQLLEGMLLYRLLLLLLLSLMLFALLLVNLFLLLLLFSLPRLNVL